MPSSAPQIPAEVWKIVGSGWFYAVDGLQYGPFSNRLAAEIDRFRRFERTSDA